ncbi:F-box domain-containing protein [Mycena kentingensis (nom. inval.)]|nr:F-box domain-containing protein [Mycena kentingensis (nom. inval.)]
MLPVELIELILEDVDDTPDLKSCCLAASVFRDRCQKKLLSSLEVIMDTASGSGSGSDAGSKRTYTEAAKRFPQCPQLATYVSSLTIKLPPRAAPGSTDSSTADSLHRVLNALTRVQSVTIEPQIRSCDLFAFGDDGGLEDEAGPYVWSYLPTNFGAILLQWLHGYAAPSKKLLHLALVDVEIPVPVMHVVLGVAETVAAYDVAFRASTDTFTACAPSSARGPKTLRVGSSRAFWRFLATQEFEPYARRLEDISFPLDSYEDPRILPTVLSSCANSLVSLSTTWFSYNIREGETIQLPHCFPRLANLEISIYHAHISPDLPESWLLPNFMRTLLLPHTTPALTTLAIRVLWTAIRHRRILTAPLSAPLAEILDSGIALHPTLRRMRWEDTIDGYLGDLDGDLGRHQREFAGILRRTLSHAEGRGLLEIEEPGVGAQTGTGHLD